MPYPLKAKEQWPSLAQDMAMLTVPNSPVNGLDDLCKTYNVSRAELKEIISIPYFQKLFERALQDVNALGTNAGAKCRALLLSQAVAESLFRQFNTGGMENKDALKFLELMLKASGLEKEAPAAQVNIQNNVALPIPAGVPKVAHCLEASSG